MMDEATTKWDGDFAGNPAGYPATHNPYWNPLSDKPVRSMKRLTADHYEHLGHEMVSDSAAMLAVKNLAVLHDALDLLVELWPKPGYQTVVIETHQWIKLRRVLLEIPRILAVDE